MHYEFIHYPRGRSIPAISWPFWVTDWHVTADVSPSSDALSHERWLQVHLCQSYVCLSDISQWSRRGKHTSQTRFNGLGSYLLCLLCPCSVCLAALRFSLFVGGLRRGRCKCWIRPCRSYEILAYCLVVIWCVLSIVAYVDQEQEQWEMQPYHISKK